MGPRFLRSREMLINDLIFAFGLITLFTIGVSGICFTAMAIAAMLL